MRFITPWFTIAWMLCFENLTYFYCEKSEGSQMVFVCCSFRLFPCYLTCESGNKFEKRSSSEPSLYWTRLIFHQGSSGLMPLVLQSLFQDNEFEIHYQRRLFNLVRDFTDTWSSLRPAGTVTCSCPAGHWHWWTVTSEHQTKASKT